MAIQILPLFYLLKKITKNKKEVTTIVIKTTVTMAVASIQGNSACAKQINHTQQHKLCIPLDGVLSLKEGCMKLPLLLILLLVIEVVLMELKELLELGVTVKKATSVVDIVMDVELIVGKAIYMLVFMLPSIKLMLELALKFIAMESKLVLVAEVLDTSAISVVCLKQCYKHNSYIFTFTFHIYSDITVYIYIHCCCLTPVGDNSICVIFSCVQHTLIAQHTRRRTGEV